MNSNRVRNLTIINYEYRKTNLPIPNFSRSNYNCSLAYPTNRYAVS